MASNLSLQPLFESLIEFAHCQSFAQIFKTAEALDLGCGVGGGNNNNDVFKVSIRATKIILGDIISKDTGGKFESFY